jgi:hypothetical protein
MFRIKYIFKKMKCKRGKEGKKMQKPSNFLNKKNRKFFNIKQFAKNLIINGDQVFKVVHGS